MGWVHLDIRWENVIYNPVQKSFVLIDSEFATPVGYDLPQMDLKTISKIDFSKIDKQYYPKEKKATPEFDWHAIGIMIQGLIPVPQELSKYVNPFLSFNLSQIEEVLKP